MNSKLSSKWCLTLNNVSTVVPPNTTPPQSPNTTAHFQVPNIVFLGYIQLLLLPVSEYRRFLVNPEIGGIGGGGVRL